MSGPRLRRPLVLVLVSVRRDQIGSESTGSAPPFSYPEISNTYLRQQDFFLPSESYDLIFLKAKIVILCTKGFEIMDLIE